MRKYRKKPIEIEAVRLPFDGGQVPESLMNFLVRSKRQIGLKDNGSVEIKTLEGVMIGNPGDWIIKGIAGEYYPCKHEIFTETYEPVEH